ncbi:MAG: DJ-1/PfpI family protein [Desulfobacteraceae bacterium]|nr:DJ-1/PfpI family protein [Desulfobacteraceae bacterium]
MSKTLLLLADGFEIYEASVFVDVLGWNRIDGDGTTELATCAIRKHIKSTFDLNVTVDVTTSEVNIDEYDALAIADGFKEFGFYTDAYDERFLEIIRGFDSQEKIIASICTAALPLGKSAVLKGRNATTYNKKQRVRQKTLEAFGVNVINEPIVIDRNIITCWNPSTAMDVAFELVTAPGNKLPGI